jgi:hypothetical protein
MKKKNGNKKEYKTLLSALAFGSTDEAQKILVDNGMKEADTYEELEYNLAKLYSNSTDKIKIEKQFAEIHPHSKFILKYLSPKVEPDTKEVRKEDLQTMETETTPPTIVEMSSNASGKSDCGCSSADGVVSTQPKIDYNALALVSIVAIVGLVIIAKK